MDPQEKTPEKITFPLGYHIPTFKQRFQGILAGWQQLPDAPAKKPQVTRDCRRWQVEPSSYFDTPMD